MATTDIRTLIGWLNVADFGAKGDGNKDDGIAFAAAIAAAPTVGALIFVPTPPVAYKITTSPSFAGKSYVKFLLMPGVTFTGTGAMPAASGTNGYVSSFADASGVITLASATLNNPTITGRELLSQGAAIAAANDLTLGSDGNTFHITGATQINRLDSTGWRDGTVARLIFDSNPLVKNNQSGSGTLRPILLNTPVDYATGVNDDLTLLYDATLDSWLEVARKGIQTLNQPIVRLGLRTSTNEAPTPAAAASAGASPPAPTVNPNSSNLAGLVNWGTGTGSSAGPQVTVTLASAFANGMWVVVTPVNTATAALNLFVTVTGGTSFTVQARTAPTDSQASGIYQAMYHVVGF